ncbi:hypothetical protein ACDQ55_13065 [Chitinophaga sp. 30R24]|uniref:hypothetical protein n=1 Tax=Chitinophaga sp. 30R24 TaxID=3248838 RepID=UPI003B9191A4
MNKKANKNGFTALLLVATLILVLLISGMPSAHKANKKDCAAITGIVQEIKNGSPGIIVHLKNDPKIYYISHKTNARIHTTDLEKLLKGKNVQLFTAHEWSPLDPFSSMKEIHRLQTADTVIFSEF